MKLTGRDWLEKTLDTMCDQSKIVQAKTDVKGTKKNTTITDH